MPLSDDCTVVVNSVAPDAWQETSAENSFSDPPEPGSQFFIANLGATCNGSTSDPFDGSFRLPVVGPTSLSCSTFENSCGVIPDDLADAAVFPGGAIEGTVCWAVKAEDAEDLATDDDPFSFGDVERVFLSLQEKSARNGEVLPEVDQPVENVAGGPCAHHSRPTSS